MSLFWISIVELSLAPLLFWLLTKLGSFYRYLDAVIFFAVGVLVLWHVLPESFAVSGWWAIAAGIVGWIGPTVAEKSLHGFAPKVDYIPMVAAIIGLCLHGMIDGIALSVERYEFASRTLPVAVLLHRLPAAVFLWWLVIGRYHWTWASGVLASLGVMTAIGYWFGLQIFPGYVDSFSFGLFQGFAAGSLLHLATHRLEDAFGRGHHHHEHN